LDATTYADFQTFASNQTGNFILLAVGASGSYAVNLRNSGSSLASYLLTGYAAGKAGYHFGHRTRLWLAINNVVQVLMLAAAAGLIYGHVLLIEVKGDQWQVLLLLAASAGPQVANARNVGVGEIPTAMLSTPC
jgi:uncharacterized membrane protein YoaK (UPF0700 family)